MSEPPPNGLSPGLLDEAIDLLGGAGRTTIWPMQGESMQPILQDGQRVVVELAPRHLERGDLLLFRQVNYLVVHRLLGGAAAPDGSPCLRTRGDGRQFFDPPVARDKVKGRVIAIEAGGSWWDLRGAGARIYALAMLLHDLKWALAAMAARKAETGLKRLGICCPLQSWVGRIDRALLGAAHAILFKRMHTPLPCPPESGCYTADSPD